MASVIPYQLRPHKAIERNLFLALLRKIDRTKKVDLEKYRYVGLGAAFLEDFKALHSEFGIHNMDCVEMDPYAYSRQVFNNPYDFIRLFEKTSTNYINDDFKEDKNQIIWWDFASPKLLRQSLIDIELTSQKSKAYDILKFTFNTNIDSFIRWHKEDYGKKMKGNNNNIHYEKVLEFIETDNTLKEYLPETVTTDNIKTDFGMIIRALAARAVRRGLSKVNSDSSFYHLCSFNYADGTPMTTITGIICKPSDFPSLVKESGVNKWSFYQADTKTELIPALNIQVPVMTVSERSVIDRHVTRKKPQILAKKLSFRYGSNLQEHNELIEGYCKFYRYLPYYSKVIY